MCTVASLGFWALFFALYWPYRRLFNEAGVYLDESVGVVAHEQTALLAVPALAFALLALLGFGVWFARRRLHP